MFRKPTRLLAVSAPVLIVCAAPLTYILAARGPAQSAPAAGAALPSAGTYQIDPIHSFVYFSAWHHVVGVVRGRFDKVTGDLTVSPDPAACAIDVTIATYSIDTQNTQRDDDLRGSAFFDVVRFPTMTYRAHGIHRAAGGGWVADGSLTIRGVTKTVPMSFAFKGIFGNMPPGRPARAAFHGTASTKRADFGMTRDNLMELGVPSAPGDDVEIQIDVEADANPPTK